MPLFEYLCRACGNRFEVLAGANRKPPDCPGCGAARTQKQLSVFSPAAARPAAPAACGAGACSAAGGCPGASACSGCPL
jgi:putative FmdB family regulatory protein